MHKVFLVEDEIAARECIREGVDWDSTGFLFSGEASDGESALPLIMELKPDIILTDIRMPFMDGLQLSRIVKKQMPWVRIIIMSGHDEFQYAREAIGIGISEYLLKPVLPQKLLESLNKAALEIDCERTELENLENLKKLVEANSALYRERFLNELVLGAFSTPEALEKANAFNIELSAKYYIAMLMETDIIGGACELKHDDYLRLDAVINNVLSENKDIIKFNRNMREAFLILKDENSSILEDTAYNVAQAMVYEVERSLRLKIKVYIGSIRERLNGLLQSVRDIENARNLSYLAGNRKIIGCGDITPLPSSGTGLLKLDRSALTSFLKSGDKTSIRDFLKDYLQCLESGETKSYLYLFFIFTDLLVECGKFIQETGGNTEKVIPGRFKLGQTAAVFNSSDELEAQAEEILKAVIDYRESQKGTRYGELIRKAKEYIESNYPDQELSLVSTAAFVNMSPNHFSSIFSQETGETFIEYLTSTRIGKAAELLRSTTLKSSEIAFKVGYNDPHYFSYMFKKVTGRTPKELRQ